MHSGKTDVFQWTCVESVKDFEMIFSNFNAVNPFTDKALQQLKC